MGTSEQAADDVASTSQGVTYTYYEGNTFHAKFNASGARRLPVRPGGGGGRRRRLPGSEGARSLIWEHTGHDESMVGVPLGQESSMLWPLT